MEAREKDRLRGSTGRQGRRRTEQRLYEGDTNTKWNQTPRDRGRGGGAKEGRGSEPCTLALLKIMAKKEVQENKGNQ